MPLLPASTSIITAVTRAAAFRTSIASATAAARGGHIPRRSRCRRGSDRHKAAARGARPRHSESTWCAVRASPGERHVHVACAVVRAVACHNEAAAFLRGLARDAHRVLVGISAAQREEHAPAFEAGVTRAAARQARGGAPAPQAAVTKASLSAWALIAATSFGCWWPRLLHSTRLDMSSISRPPSSRSFAPRPPTTVGAFQSPARTSCAARNHARWASGHCLTVASAGARATGWSP